MAELLARSGLAQVHKVAAGHVGHGPVPGLVALIAQGDQVRAEVLGSLAVGGPAHAASSSLLRIPSLTEPVTRWPRWRWPPRGCCGWISPVDRLLPELAPSRRVLRQIDGPLDDTVPAGHANTRARRARVCRLRPRSLLRDVRPDVRGRAVARDRRGRTTAPAGHPRAARTWPTQPDPDAWIAGLGSLPLLAQPGEHWFFNAGASVLGVLCTRASRPAVRRGAAQPDLRAAGHPGRRVLNRDRDHRLRHRVPAGGQTACRCRNSRKSIFSQPPPFGDRQAACHRPRMPTCSAFSRMLLRGGARRCCTRMRSPG